MQINAINPGFNQNQIGWYGYGQEFVDSLFKAFSLFPSTEQTITQNAIAVSAKNEEYGNKHAGLIKVAELLAQDPIDGVVIPLPKGLSHASVESFLQKKDPLIFSQWEKLGLIFSEKYKNPSFVENMLKNLVRYLNLGNPKDPSFLEDPEVLTLLSDIQRRIENAFNNLSQEDLDFFGTEELTTWINELAAKKSFLMVRSSGVEDTKELANAGGNLSEGYVAAELKEILSASGRVVASYFGLSSLKNRLSANTNPFETPLVLPVMLHELIGEEVGGAKDPKDIPVSLVLFTTEPNDSEEGFHVTKISSAFGHGEGVVGAKNIASDTIHVIESVAEENTFISAYQNRQKETRLAPCKDPITGKIELQPVANPDGLEYERTLDDAMISRLAVLAKKLESLFENHPMDVEIVIKQGIIHIVQARPVIRPTATPSYFNIGVIQNLEQNGLTPLLQSIPAKVLTPGKGSAEIFTDPNKLLICNSLKEAETLFDSKRHSCVLVKEDEPANSHPVVNFSSLGIPCFYLETDSFSLQASEDLPIIICPQTGKIYQCDSSIVNPRSCISNGYISHPASLGLSLFDRKIENQQKPTKRIKPSPEISNLLRTLQEEQVSQIAQTALKELQQAVRSEIQETTRVFSSQNAEPPAFLEKLSAKLELIWTELETDFTKPLPRLHKLFLVKTLSSLLTGQVEGSLSTYSLLDVTQAKKIMYKNISYIEKVRLFKDTSDWEDLTYVGEYALSEEAEGSWHNFLLSLEKLPITDKEIANNKASLKALLSSLQEFSSADHLLGSFFNFFLLPRAIQIADPKAALAAIASLSTEEQKLIQVLASKEKQIAKLKNNLSSFEFPASIEAAQKELFELHDFFSDKANFLQLLQNGSDFSKILTSEILKELVEVSDLAIKSMKKSSVFSNQEKITHMNTMLKSNFAVLSSWFTDLVPKQISDFLQNSILPSTFRYLQFIERHWNGIDLTNEENLFPSNNFSVGAAVVNSQANFRRHPPQTLEDIFTLIHQNQIVAVSSLSMVSKDISALPSPIHKAIQEVRSIISSASLYGIEVSQESARLQYNIPLNNHSAGLEIEYRKEDGSFLIHGKLFGESRERWPACKAYIEALHSAGGLHLQKSPVLSTQELLFTWSIKDENELQSSIEQFKQFLDYSFQWNSQSIFELMANYIGAQKDKIIRMGKWFHEHKIQGAEVFINAYLATI